MADGKGQMAKWETRSDPPSLGAPWRQAAVVNHLPSLLVVRWESWQDPSTDTMNEDEDEIEEEDDSPSEEEEDPGKQNS